MSNLIPVKILSNLEDAKFYIEKKRLPFIIKTCNVTTPSEFNLGECLTKWSVDYLKNLVKSRPVKIHVSENECMNFLEKNFLYKTLPFDELIERASKTSGHSEYFISPNEKYYLRSLGDDDRKDVADIKKQFPQLSREINFPPFFDYEKQFFSSVFRIGSSQLRLWTHYDIMDNVLIQISGHKRVVLYPPSDVEYLYLKGDKSQVIEIDNPDLNKYPLFSKATRYECELFPGDFIFIPALWFHNVITLSFSIGVNVFWKHLSDDFYEKRDVYGNKDLIQASKAFLFVDKSIKELKSLPNEYKIFYTKRLIQNLNESLSKNDNELIVDQNKKEEN